MYKGFWKKLAAAAVTAAMLVSLAACSSAKKDAGADGSEDVKTFIDVLEDGSIVCYLDKTEKGTGGGSSITIEEGEYLVIDSEITRNEGYSIRSERCQEAMRELEEIYYVTESTMPWVRPATGK